MIVLRGISITCEVKVMLRQAISRYQGKYGLSYPLPPLAPHMAVDYSWREKMEKGFHIWNRQVSIFQPFNEELSPKMSDSS